MYTCAELRTLVWVAMLSTMQLRRLAHNNTIALPFSYMGRMAPSLFVVRFAVIEGGHTTGSLARLGHHMAPFGQLLLQCCCFLAT